MDRIQLGILGGGQLGMFLAAAADRLGAAAHIYCPDGHAPARRTAQSFVCAAYDDHAALQAWRREKNLRFLTYEFENVPLAALNALQAADLAIQPPAKALAITQDRLAEKRFCQSLGAATAPFRPVNSLQDLAAAQQQFGGEAIVKTRSFGYDGKGQWRLGHLGRLGAGAHAPQEVWAALAGRPAIAEARINFEKEVSLICTRFADGDFQAFALTQNLHRHHILHQSRVPADVPEKLARAARELGARMTKALDYVGTLAIEFFVCKGALLVNELAPRVHNSGHWTLDACASSQFEQHLRAILGLGAGDTARTHDAVMTNLIGEEVRGWEKARPKPGQHIHIYGKSEIRPGRKMGHVTQLSEKTAPPEGAD